MKDLRLPRDERELIAQWGAAKLVKTLGGRFELHGGTAEDRRQAGDWIRAFYPKAVYVLGGTPTPNNNNQT